MAVRDKSVSALLLVLVVLLQGCGDIVCDCENSNPYPFLMKSAKDDLAKGDYSAAQLKCLKVEEHDDTYDEAKYCVLLASTAAVVHMLFNPVTCLIACDPISVAPSSFRFKEHAIFPDLEYHLAMISGYAGKLAAMENPHFHIDSFPLPFYGLEQFLGFEIGLDIDEPLNFRGTWDKSEALLIGSVANAMQAGLNYAFAHQLVFSDLNLPSDSSEAAEFLQKNPLLLAGDPDAKERLVTFRSAVLNMLALLSAHPAAVKISAAEAGMYPDQVMRWIDDDGDGIATAVEIPALDVLSDDVRIPEDTTTILSPFGPAVWRAIFAATTSLRDNVTSNGTKPVALGPVLQAIYSAVGLGPVYSDIRIFRKPPPGNLQSNPGAFLKAPKYLAELTPSFFTYNTGTTTTGIDLAYEEERWTAGTDTNRLVAGYAGDVSAPDWAHFDFGAPLTVAAGVTLQDFMFTPSKPAKLVADGVSPDEKTPVLVYVGWQDASFGGLLPTATSNHVLNRDFNVWLKHYCLDVTLADPWGPWGLLGVIDEHSYPSENQIDYCL